MNPFEHVPRRKFTPQQRAKVFAENDGRCGWINAGKHEGCGRRLSPADRWRIEHGNALEKGGDNTGLGISCEWCWPAKDAEDHADAGHFRRVYTKHNVPSEFRRSRSWRS